MAALAVAARTTCRLARLHPRWLLADRGRPTLAKPTFRGSAPRSSARAELEKVPHGTPVLR